MESLDRGNASSTGGSVELVVVSTDSWMMASLYLSSDNVSVSLVTNSSQDDGSGSADSAGVERCMWFRFAVNTVVIGLLCVLGLMGNTLSLFVLERDRHNRVAVFLLQSLATADNLVLCVAFVELTVVYGLLPMVGRHDVLTVSTPYFIKYVNPVGYMVQSCAVWLTMLLAANRYVAICRPFVAPRWLTIRRTRLKVALVVAVSIVLNVPRFFRIDIIGSPSHNSTNVTSSRPYTYTALAENFYFKVIYLNVFYPSVVLILPLVLILTLNVRIIKSLQASRRRVRLSSLEPYCGRSETNISIVMVAIVLELVLCHTPDRVLQVTIAILRHKAGSFHCPHVMSYCSDISNMLMIVSSSTNFVIYFLLRPHFRASLRDRVMCADSRSHLDDGSIRSAASEAAWKAEPSSAAAAAAEEAVEQNVKLTSVVDHNNHINASGTHAATDTDSPASRAVAPRGHCQTSLM